ncbi:MAG TPA: pilus assembly PilX N-terminal domain-containing protein, partial [Nitrospiria bacterium]
MTGIRNNKGGALLLAIGLLAVMTLLGTVAVRMSMEEVSVSGIQKGSVQVRYLAESGVGLLIQWFQEPRLFPGVGEYPLSGTSGEPGRFLSRREITARGTPSFFDPFNGSQFKGTWENPDFLLRAEDASGDIRGLGSGFSGFIRELRIYGPTRPGSLCTIEATARNSKGARHTVQAQLVPSPLLPVSAAYQFGIGEGGVVPSKVHWGDVRIEGNADLGDALERLPVKDSFAPVNSDPYKESGRRDRWVDFEIGGRVKNPQSKTCGECPHPFGDEGHGNIIQGLGEGNPGWGIDPWDYARLKRFAREWGTIYRPDSEGFVYSEKEGAAGKRLLAIEALEAVRADGSRRPFVFIDTLDGLPPGEGNLATLHLPVRYLKG